MPVTKTITLYTFDELSDTAKETARNWFREASAGDSYAAECTVDDAKVIGLVIISLDQHRANKGKFVDDAETCAQAIIKEHGDTCETYKTAKRFLLSLDSLNVEHPEDCDGYRGQDYDDEKEEMEEEFLRSLLNDYWRMLEQEYEYRDSDEVIDETICANEYTFTETGKRED